MKRPGGCEPANQPEPTGGGRGRGGAEASMWLGRGSASLGEEDSNISREGLGPRLLASATWVGFWQVLGPLSKLEFLHSENGAVVILGGAGVYVEDACGRSWEGRGTGWPELGLRVGSSGVNLMRNSGGTSLMARG